MNKKSLITAALIAAGIISQASADQVVYLTGSTAFRSTIFTVLTDNLGNGVFDAGTEVQTAARGPGSGNGATYMLFHGNVAGVPTYVDCSWNGSDAGMGSVLNITVDNDGGPLFGAPAFWLKPNGTVNTIITNNAVAADLEAASHQGDLAFADTSVAGGIAAVRNANALTAMKAYGPLGVVTFTWVKNQNTASGASAAKTAWTDLVNISTLEENNLLAAGSLPADYFTGNFADNTTSTYLVGRNKGSGTRATELLNAQFGVDNTVVQYTIGGGTGFNADGTAASPDGTLTLAPALDPLGVTADNGYESGGSVAAALGVAGSTSQTDPFNGNGGWLAVGFLGCSDAVKSGLTVAANWLTENGVLESNGAIESGTYSAWGYENLYGKPTIVANSTQDKVGQLILAHTPSHLGGAVAANHDASIQLGLMHASKTTDFSFPTHN